jgi:hypothetical protein
MPVLYFFLFIAIAALYLGYVACAVPIAAAVAFAAYGVGLPVAYFIGLVARPGQPPGSAPRPEAPAEAPRARRPRGTAVLLRPGADRRRSGGTGRLHHLP